MTIDERLEELGITLPNPSQPAAAYTNCIKTGNILYVSGKGPGKINGEFPTGKLGQEFTVEDGYIFAKSTGLDILAAVKHFCGSLDAITQVIKLQGFVNATANFTEQPKVLDGCSDLMCEVFREQGVHTRSVFGAVSVRSNLPIIIDSIFETSL